MYQQRHRWPALTLLAIEIPSIAAIAMSDDVERKSLLRSPVAVAQSLGKEQGLVLVKLKQLNA
jgi:hypothetical protein